MVLHNGLRPKSVEQGLMREVMPLQGYDVVDDAAQIDPELLQSIVCAFPLFDVGVALVLDQHVRTCPLAGRTGATPRCASGPDVPVSRARRSSRASVGNITFLGCTVVSTITPRQVRRLERLGLRGDRQALLQKRLRLSLRPPGSHTCPIWFVIGQGWWLE